MRVTIRVQPRARHSRIGGNHNGALLIRVTEPAVDGSATAAALAVLAKALGLPPRQVVLVSGAKNRTKIVELPDSAAANFATLQQHQAPPRE